MLFVMCAYLSLFQDNDPRRIGEEWIDPEALFLQESDDYPLQTDTAVGVWSDVCYTVCWISKRSVVSQHNALRSADPFHRLQHSYFGLIYHMKLFEGDWTKGDYNAAKVVSSFEFPL